MAVDTRYQKINLYIYKLFIYILFLCHSVHIHKKVQTAVTTVKKKDVDISRNLSSKIYV